MTFIATLLSSNAPISIVHLEQIEHYIKLNGIGISSRSLWIKDYVAACIGIQNFPTMDQVKDLRGILAGDKIDILFTPKDSPKIKLFLADMDSTIVTSETLDELAAKAGIKDKISAITSRAMNGELDFHAALIERVSLLEGLPFTALKKTLDETVLCEGAKELVEGLRESGTMCVLVSGGFTYFTKAVAEQCGFHHHHGNILNHDGVALDGTVGMPILDKDSKLTYLKSYAKALGLDLSQTMAIGDGANDLPMLLVAGLGIGYRPKKVVEDTIPNVLKYADYTALNYVINS